LPPEEEEHLVDSMPPDSVRALELLFTLFDLEGRGVVHAHHVALALRHAHALPPPHASTAQANRGESLLPLDGDHQRRHGAGRAKPVAANATARAAPKGSGGNQGGGGQSGGTMALSAVVSAAEMAVLVRRFEMGCRWRAEADEEEDAAAEAAHGGGGGNNLLEGEEEDEERETTANQSDNGGGEGGGGGGSGAACKFRATERAAAKARWARRRLRFADALIDETQFILAFRDIVM
jgi:hypothetical protein